MRTQPEPIDDVPADPVDLVAVQADDELINALAAGMAVSAPGFGGYDTDDRVAAMLATWKADVDAEPIPQLIDIDVATAAVVSGRAPGHGVWYLRPLAGAAALLVFAVAGMSIGAQDSRPGDPLWSVSKVLFQEHAESVEALAVVEGAQQKAKELLAVGDKDGAAAALEEGRAAASVVLAEDGQGVVVQELRRLEVEVADTIPGVPNVVEDPVRSPTSETGATGPAEGPTGSAEGRTGPAEGPTGPTEDPDQDSRSLSSDAGTTTPAPADDQTTPPATSTTPADQSTTTADRPRPGSPPPTNQSGAEDGLSGASTTASGTATTGRQPPPTATTKPPPPTN